MLIALEGIDGAGKYTQADLLRTQAQSAGWSATTLSFPRYGETLFAQSIAEYLNGKFGGLAAIVPHFPALLYAGDRFESRSIIAHLSQSYDLLILDRYVASNLAYQAAKLPREHRQAFLAWLAQVEYDIFGLPKAELTVYLDVPVEVASQMVLKKKQRSYTMERADMHERDSQYLAACREVYQGLAAMNYRSAWLSIQCTRSNAQMREAPEICAAIWQGIEPTLRAARMTHSTESDNIFKQNDTRA